VVVRKINAKPAQKETLYSTYDSTGDSSSSSFFLLFDKSLIWRTAQVFIISLLGKHVRAIEAYFDGHHLVLRCTPLYSFRDDPSTTLKDLTEWYMGAPVGNTF
jgi:hypothetical protein